MKEQAGKLFAWLGRNERHLGAVLFVFGFITDLLTFTLLSVSLVNIAFLSYLGLATVCTLGSHSTSPWRDSGVFWKKALSVLFPLGAQYAIGSLLSGCLIFFTKSSALFASWPFLLLLALVFIGNEFFRTYYKHLAFQLVLMFFGLYAYAIFALPYYLHELGPLVFVGSTVLSVLVFALLYYVLLRIRRTDVERGFRYALGGVVGITFAMNAAYFTGFIPPIPLTLPGVGVYHSIVATTNGYTLTREDSKPWWDVKTEVVHHVAGTPLYVWSAVSAPTAFATGIVHVWQHYDPNSKHWTTVSRVSFPILGGRDGGYRGYSELEQPTTGTWRVTIETPGGQAIGRVVFMVEDVTTPPTLITETK